MVIATLVIIVLIVYLVSSQKPSLSASSQLEMPSTPVGTHCSKCDSIQRIFAFYEINRLLPMTSIWSASSHGW